MIESLMIIEIPFRFAFGWIFHANKTLPFLLENWRAALLPLGCLILAGILAHRFIRRTLAAKGISRPWRPADTLASTMLLLLGCGAAIALSGVVHESVWLMSDRWVESNRRSELTMAVNNSRQLMMALADYHEMNGRYPNSLRELEIELDTPRQLAWTEVTYKGVREPFILLHPGETRLMNEDEPLIVSPIIQKDGKIVVGYGDSSVKSLPAGEFSRILQAASLRKNQPPPAGE
ncbi:MAG: hypothetical protein ABIS50_10905 [Luteolibacter sp.]|uniref:hypothetical protein n=1 Tax=Luteolibacter sp. TaxID=1962973 RepID=UPI0032631E54